MLNYHDKPKPKELTRIPDDEVNAMATNINTPLIPDEVWISRHYLVQVFHTTHIEHGAMTRLTINSVKYNRAGWKDGLKWEELQQVKADVGYSDCYAIEIYPKDRDIINDANMRHLWIFRDNPLDIGWTRK